MWVAFATSCFRRTAIRPALSVMLRRSATRPVLRARSSSCSTIHSSDSRWGFAAGRSRSRATGSIASWTTSTRSTARCADDTLQLPAMTSRRALDPFSVRAALACITLVAVAHGLFFIWYQRPDWPSQWPDQVGYRRLGAVLAATGKFTPFPHAHPFVPEVIRTPAYPLFVATIYKVAGVRQLPVALAQTALFAVICLLVFAIARRIASDGVALGAAALTALFA